MVKRYRVDVKVELQDRTDGKYVLYKDYARLQSALQHILESEPSMDAETGEYGLFVSPETVKMVRKVMEE